MYTQKHLELLRFYVIDKIDDSTKMIKEEKTNNIDEIVSTVFSALVSSVTSALDITIDNHPIISTAIKIFVLSIAFLASKYIVSKIIKEIRANSNRNRIIKKELNQNEIKKLVDKFDHIACEGILLSKEYIDLYNSSKEDENLSEFYYYESIYYFEKSLDIVKVIYNNRNQCINAEKSTGVIDAYRFNNLLKMMSDTLKTIKEIKEQENFDSNLFHHNFKKITETFESIKNVL